MNIHKYQFTTAMTLLIDVIFYFCKKIPLITCIAFISAGIILPNDAKASIDDFYVNGDSMIDSMIINLNGNSDDKSSWYSEFNKTGYLPKAAINAFVVQFVLDKSCTTGPYAINVGAFEDAFSDLTGLSGETRTMEKFRSKAPELQSAWSEKMRTIFMLLIQARNGGLVKCQPYVIGHPQALAVTFSDRDLTRYPILFTSMLGPSASKVSGVGEMKVYETTFFHETIHIVQGDMLTLLGDLGDLSPPRERTAYMLSTCVVDVDSTDKYNFPPVAMISMSIENNGNIKSIGAGIEAASLTALCNKYFNDGYIFDDLGKMSIMSRPKEAIPLIFKAINMDDHIAEYFVDLAVSFEQSSLEDRAEATNAASAWDKAVALDGQFATCRELPKPSEEDLPWPDSVPAARFGCPYEHTRANISIRRAREDLIDRREQSGPTN